VGAFNDVLSCDGSVHNLRLARQSVRGRGRDQPLVWRRPFPDVSIRGAVTGPNGLPARDTAVEAYGRWANPEPDGTFDVVAPSGSYIIGIHVLVDSEWFFVGWYDGSGGITTDLSQAFEVTLEGADVEGIEIVVPADRASLLCPPGSWRSSRDGRCV